MINGKKSTWLLNLKNEDEDISYLAQILIAWDGNIINMDEKFFIDNKLIEPNSFIDYNDRGTKHEWTNDIRICPSSICLSNQQNLNCWSDFTDQMINIINGILLCKKHHHLYGMKHTTKEMFEEYIQSTYPSLIIDKQIC